MENQVSTPYLDPPKWPLSRGEEDEAMLLAMAYVRHQRDQMLQVAVQFLNRYRNRVDFGQLPGCLRTDAEEVATYAEALRQVPTQKGFPYEIAWPTTPRVLKGDIVN